MSIDEHQSGESESVSHEDDLKELTVPKGAASPDDKPDDDDSLPQFVTTLASMEQQVGLHVIEALQHPRTIGVLTTVASGGDGSQQIVSVGLDPDRFEQIQKILLSAKEDRKQSIQCIGFHCHFGDDETAQADPNEDDSQS